MKHLFVIIICLIGVNTFAQQNVEIAPNSKINLEATMGTDSLNLQFSFPCTAFVGEYGVQTDGSNIYVTQWYGDLFAKYDQDGNVLDTFLISVNGQNIGHIRDMAYDGQYYYGGRHSNYFYKLDLDNKAVIDTIYIPFTVRGMTYDPIENILWASENWTPMFYKMDMQGNILDSWLPVGITLESISGLAIDNNSVGGPFLWGFSQDSTQAIIVKYDIANQAQTGNMIDVSGLSPGSYAGGLFISQMAPRTGLTIGGMMQNELVFAFDLDYANMLVTDLESHDMISTLDIYPNPAVDVLNIKIELDNKADLTFNILNQAGQVIQNHSVTANKSTNISINTNMLESGIYFVQIGNEKEYSITKKFIIAK